jgi:predicted nucleic acid-binding Zn ribbon protein
MNDQVSPAASAARASGRSAEAAALDRIRGSSTPIRRRRPQASGQWSGRDPKPLGEAFEALVESGGWESDVARADAIVRWDEIVGPAVAAHAKPVSFDAAALVVQADSATWATELRLLTPQLLARCAQVVGAGVVATLVIRGPATVAPRGPRRSRHR